MARRPNINKLIEKFISQFSGELANAFFGSIGRVRDEVRLKDLVKAIENNDIPAVIRVLSMDRAAFRPIEAAIERAFETGGTAVVQSLPAGLLAADGYQATFRFDIRNLRAEQWLRQNSATLVTRIIEDQREALRIALDRGMNVGANPRTTALDLVGRIDPASGRRKGGIIGLTSQQARWVGAASAELTSGDPESLTNYLTRNRRDARFDPTVIRAINSGKPIPATTIAKMVGRYSDSLLLMRGETVGRTEAINALNRSAYEGYKQAVDAGAVQKDAARKVWDSAGNDGRTRDSHIAMDGQEVGIDEPFVSTLSGARLMYPGDTSSGAPAGETINCRCRIRWKIDYFAGLGTEPEPEPIIPILPPSPLPPIIPPRFFDPDPDPLDDPDNVIVRNSRLDEEQKSFVVNQGRATGVEQLSAYDEVTGELFDRNTGSASHVSIPPRMDAALQDPNRSVVVHHNHPRSTSFSGQDITMLMRLPGMRSIWAHGHDGSSYYAERGVQPSIPTFQAVQTMVYNTLIDFVKRNKIDGMDAGVVDRHLHMLLSQDRGLIEYQFTLAGKTAEIIARNQALIDFIRKTVNELL